MSASKFSPRDANESLTKDLDKEVDSLQVCQLVVVSVYAYAKEETGITPVYDLVILELLHVMRIRRWVAFRPILTSTKFDWCFWSRGATSLCTSPRSLTLVHSQRHGSSQWCISYLLVVVVRNIPLRQPCLPLTVLSAYHLSTWSFMLKSAPACTRMNLIMVAHLPG